MTDKFTVISRGAEVEIPGYIIGELGISNANLSAPDQRLKHYHVTHLPTGLGFSHVTFKRLRDAKEFANAANAKWNLSGEDPEKFTNKETGQLTGDALALRAQIVKLAQQYEDQA